METPVTLQISRYGLWESRTCEYTDSSNNVSLVCWKINQLSNRNMPRAFGWNFPILSLFFIRILMKAPWDTNSIETSLTVINAVQGFKKTLMANWSLIENQPLLKENTSDYNYPTGKSLKHMPLRWKNITWRQLIIRRNHKKAHSESAQVCLWLNPFNSYVMSLTNFGLKKLFPQHPIGWPILQRLVLKEHGKVFLQRTWNLWSMILQLHRKKEELNT